VTITELEKYFEWAHICILLFLFIYIYIFLSIDLYIIQFDLYTMHIIKLEEAMSWKEGWGNEKVVQKRSNPN